MFVNNSYPFLSLSASASYRSVSAIWKSIQRNCHNDIYMHGVLLHEGENVIVEW